MLKKIKSTPSLKITFLTVEKKFSVGKKDGWDWGRHKNHPIKELISKLHALFSMIKLLNI